MSRSSTAHIFVCFTVTFTLALVGCGDDSSPPPFEPNNTTNNQNNENNENNQNNENNENNMNNMVDMGPDADPDGGDDPDMADMGDTDTDTDADMSCPAVPCAMDKICVDGTCLEGDSCGSAFDLGAIDPGGSVQRSGSFLFEGTDQLELSCSGDDASRERVFRFELTGESIVDIDVNWTGQFDGATAIRTVCDDASSEEFCSDNELIRDVQLEAGTYFLILEVRFGNPGAFEFELETQPVACTLGDRRCVGNVLEICADGRMIESFSCATTCVNGECTGDTCSNPIVINDAGDTFSGDGGGYTSALNFSNSTCSMDMSSGTNTPGYELVFSLPGLSVGDVIDIDPTVNDDPNINAIFVRNACGDLGSCLATFTGEEDVDYVVQTPGDHWVIVDKTQPTRTMFNYSVTVFP